MQHDHPSSLGGSIAMLDRAAHFPSVLLLLAFSLGLDSALAVTYHSTLMSMSLGFIRENVTLGAALMFFVCFGIFMSLGALLAKIPADEIVAHTLLPLWRLSFRNNSRPPMADYVNRYALRKAAHQEQNKFYFDRYKEHEDLLNNNQRSEQRVATTAFACLLLLVFNFALGSMGYAAITNEVAANVPNGVGTVYGLLFLGLTVVWLLPVLKDPGYDDWVYCPPLYRQLEKEKTKAYNAGTN